MNKISEINLGYNDASSYNLNQKNKKMLADVFIKDEKLDDLMRENTFYLIGEKGTGKTAYAIFLQNSCYMNTKTKVINIKETDFHIFMSMYKNGWINLSDYEKIWQIIILLLAAESIDKKDIAQMGPKRSKLLCELKDAIDSYYKNAFIPEIPNIIKYVVEKSSSFNFDLSAEILNTPIKSSLTNSKSKKDEKSGEITLFQNNLGKLAKDFKNAFARLKINKNIFIIVDNVDVSLTNFGVVEYQNCLKGLAEAIWSVNADVFSQMGDSNNFIKAILSIRPDIFANLDIHNQANKIRDNSVVLDWRTTYENYRSSALFKMCCKLLSYNNPDIKEESAWDYYFPWSKPTSNETMRERDDSFIIALRYSLCRPRDLISIMKAIQMTCKKNGHDISTVSDFDSNETQNEISEYYVAEAKDWCTYKINADGFNTLLFFFQFLNGNSVFTYEEYSRAFKEFFGQVGEKKLAFSEETLNEREFLQLLYDLNMIGYFDDPTKTFIRYCYREREISCLKPQVKFDTNYRVHHALLKALNLGKGRF